MKKKYRLHNHKKESFIEKYSFIFVVLGNIAQIATVIATFLMIKYTLVPIYQKEYLQEQNIKLQKNVENKQDEIKKLDDNINDNLNQLNEIKVITRIYDFKNYVLDYYNRNSLSSRIYSFLDGDENVKDIFEENSDVVSKILNEYCIIKGISDENKSNLEKKIAEINLGKDKYLYTKCLKEISGLIVDYKNSLEKYADNLVVDDSENYDVSTLSKEEIYESMITQIQLLMDRLRERQKIFNNIQRRQEYIEKIYLIADKYPSYYSLLSKYIDDTFGGII